MRASCELNRRTKPDVIHLWEEPWSLVALQAVLLRGRSAVLLEVDQNILRRLPPPFEAIRRFVLQRTDLILSRSTDATAVVQACGYRGPVRKIGYGVDQAAFHPKPDAEPLRGRARPIRIGYAGRLVEGKGIDDVLTALTQTSAPAEFAIMGEGEYEIGLRKRVAHLDLSHRTTFERWGPLTRVGEFLRSLDVSVLMTRSAPTWREQFGRTIIESQACGVPVIGSTCGAIPEVVGDGGWIIPERDAQALSKLLSHLQSCPEEIRSRGLAAVANVKQRFTFSAVADVLASAWREAAELTASRRASR